jgi:hypothetical protein
VTATLTLTDVIDEEGDPCIQLEYPNGDITLYPYGDSSSDIDTASRVDQARNARDEAMQWAEHSGCMILDRIDEP